MAGVQYEETRCPEPQRVGVVLNYASGLRARHDREYEYKEGVVI